LADDRVKQVKEANDIVDVVGSYISLRQAGPTFKGLCPFHDDHRPSFDVDPRRQRYRCWSCGEHGDVLTFVQKYDKVSFIEALELLARRAGISLEKTAVSPQARTRALMLDVVRWAAKQYHECLLDSPLAEEARVYVGQRGLKGETVRNYELGFAPRTGEWLVRRAEAAGMSLELLEQVGMIAPRTQGSGYYDRFRDRLQFPIRNERGQTVGFGGRILPSSPLSSRGPKYYNSSDTPLFTKSEQLYGIDQARAAAEKTGYLAVVEGYTDVLMAHQMGIVPVVATMGTALNGRHVQKLRHFAPRVVLVFDADVGGNTGVDRALELFASNDAELAIATLPAGLDPCDLLVKEGPESFRKVLEGAVDALEFKLNQVLAAEDIAGIEGKRRAVDAVLRIIALAPQLPGHAGDLKTQLIVTRIARRLTLKEETVWARLDELRRGRGEETAPKKPTAPDTSEPARQAKAAPEERELLEVLLADPALVPIARGEIAAETVQHPGLRQLLQGLYDLLDAGETPTLDNLRPRLDNLRLESWAMERQEVGSKNGDREGWLQQILARFHELRREPAKQELRNQLQAATDHATAVERLRQLQNLSGEGGTRQPAEISRAASGGRQTPGLASPGDSQPPLAGGFAPDAVVHPD
jgi:DNA primase